MGLSLGNSVKVVKCVKQNYDAPAELLFVMEQFRGMVNRAITVGLERNITSRFKLRSAVYSELHNGLHTHYIYGAVEKATAILKNYRKALRKANAKGKTVRMPYVCKAFLSLDNQSYRIIDGVLRVPIQPRQFIKIPLNSHTVEVLSQPNLKLGSVTMTAFTLVIAFSKEIDTIEPDGYMGIDRNLDNITMADTEGNVEVINLHDATLAKQQYRETVSHLKRNDVRIRRKIAGKHGRIEKERVKRILHNASKFVVDYARERNMAIVMEDIKGIRKLYQKGNGQGRQYRGRMASWSYYELQRQIEYKAQWEGLPVIYVKAGGTSSKCSVCGDKLFVEEGRMMYCVKCHRRIDRDMNASINILNRGVRFAPVGPAGEAMKGNPVVSYAPKVIPGADAGQLHVTR